MNDSVRLAILLEAIRRARYVYASPCGDDSANWLEVIDYIEQEYELGCRMVATTNSVERGPG